MLPNDLFVQLFGFFIAHSTAMHSKKSLNLIKNLYLVSLQNIMELSLIFPATFPNLYPLWVKNNETYFYHVFNFKK